MKKLVKIFSMSGVAVSALLVSSVLLCANSEGNAGRVPVDHLLSMSAGKPWAPLPTNIAAATREGIARDQARLYIFGIIDSGEGQRWCTGSAGVPPHEVENILISRLGEQVRAVPDTKSISAGQRVSVILEKGFPCNL